MESLIVKMDLMRAIAGNVSLGSLCVPVVSVLNEVKDVMEPLTAVTTLMNLIVHLVVE